MTAAKRLFTVEVDGNLIVVTRFGTQTTESVEAIRQEVKQLMDANSALRDILVIVKATSMVSSSSAQASTQSLNELPYSRVAIVSAAPQKLVNAKNIVNASEAGERVKIFRNQEDARAWLEKPITPSKTDKNKI